MDIHFNLKLAGSLEESGVLGLRKDVSPDCKLSTELLKIGRGKGGIIELPSDHCLVIGLNNETKAADEEILIACMSRRGVIDVFLLEEVTTFAKLVSGVYCNFYLPEKEKISFEKTIKPSDLPYGLQLVLVGANLMKVVG